MTLPRQESMAIIRNRIASATRAARDGRHRPQTREELHAYGEAVLSEIRAQARRGEWAVLGALEMDGIELARLAFTDDGGIDIGFYFEKTPIAELVAKGSTDLGRVR